MNSRKPTKLRIRRIGLGVSLDDVAAATGISRSELGFYERGVGRSFIEEKERRLAAYFKMSLDQLRKEAGFKKATVWVMPPARAARKRGAA